MKSKFIFLCLSLLIISIPINVQEGWFWQNPYQQGNDIKDIFVIDSNKAVAVGNTGTVIITQDGGINWSVKHYSAGTDADLISVYFTDENTGWAVGNENTIIKTTDGGNSWHQILVSVENFTDIELLENFQLEQNYPNPFNPSTRIKYQIPVISFVTIKVYDVLGNEIVTLVDDEKPAGNYEVEFSAIGGSASGGDAYNLPSGIYFYQLRADDFVESKKMVLLK